MKKFICNLFFLTVLLFCSWNVAFSIDKDLEFLTYLSNEDLQPLVTIIENKQDNKLSRKAKNNPKEHIDEIMNELEKEGNSFSYRHIIEEICKLNAYYDTITSNLAELTQVPEEEQQEDGVMAESDELPDEVDSLIDEE